MISSWQVGLLLFLRTTSQILMAGVAITAFALLLYSMAFNLRERVARSFILILFCVTTIYTAQAIGSASGEMWQVIFWLHIQWVGIIFLPPTYLHFSDALLANTGKPSRWRRVWAIRLIYGMAFIFVILLASGYFIGSIVSDSKPTPHLQPIPITYLFSLYYLIVMGMAWYNFIRAYKRSITPTTRRRTFYLILGALAPALGSFPFMFLLFGSELAARHLFIYWTTVIVSTILIGILVVVMAYAVAFYGVSWPDRVVKSRLFKWILRGPITASLTLAMVTIVRRLGEMYGSNYSAMVPIVMVGTILMFQYLITIFSPFWERVIFSGNERQDMITLRRLEDYLLTQNDLRQFIEMVLAAVCDRLQVPGAYLAVLEDNSLELLVTVGKFNSENGQDPIRLFELVSGTETLPEVLQWGPDTVIPLQNGDGDIPILLGLLIVTDLDSTMMDAEQSFELKVLTQRAALALRDRHTQQDAFSSLQSIGTDIDLIERYRAIGRYDGSQLLSDEAPPLPTDVTQWVKEALNHYWGGPKLTQSPLLDLQIVQESLPDYDGNPANTLRGVLREAIDRVKPEGERRFTGEWILYNILDMKFLEGRKVREVAMRLSMSEADLYRKQRVAIEAVTKTILEMELRARNQPGHS